MPAFARPPPQNRGTTSALATIFLNGQCPFVPMPQLFLMGNARAARGQEENLKLSYNFELVCFFNSQNRFDGKNYLLYFQK